jgi:hypothetical protein
VKFDPKIAKLVEFTIESRNSKIFPISLSKNGEILPKTENNGWAPQELSR